MASDDESNGMPLRGAGRWGRKREGEKYGGSKESAHGVTLAQSVAEDRESPLANIGLCMGTVQGTRPAHGSC
eukprot:354114-Chlamydomonas_euryale.AAC.4